MYRENQILRRNYRALFFILSAALFVASLLAVHVPVYAQDSEESTTYQLPQSWTGESMAYAESIAEAAPPFQLTQAVGDFTFTYLPTDGTIRILPDKANGNPGESLELSWAITGAEGQPSLATESVFLLEATTRTFSPPDGVSLTIREFDGEEWSSSSVPMTEVVWSDFSVTREIAEDAIEVQVGLKWALPNDKAWVEFKDMSLTVLPASDTTDVNLSPTDTPTPAVHAAESMTDTTADTTTVVSSGPLIIVTSTPTPPNVFAAATQLALAATLAAKNGAPTPTPDNMVTATPTPVPMVITNTPTPQNEATATYEAVVATAIAATTGTPTPYSDGVVVLTATPTPSEQPTAASPPSKSANTKVAPKAPAGKKATPIFVLVEDLIFPTSTPTPPYPAELKGKILFKSDYLARDNKHPKYFMINPDGTGLALLTGSEFYNRAKELDAYSADQRFYAYNQREPLGGRKGLIQIYYDDSGYNSFGHQLTYFGVGTAWAPVFSPTDSRTIALVSSESKNDEIWIARRDEWPPQQITKNEWEWDRSPSFSTDGTQIVFESNRVGGTRQIWVMDTSGKNPHQITSFPYEAWEPVWVKYVD